MAAPSQDRDRHLFVANVHLKRQALDQLASTDLIELCNEAKIESCRATRDLSSCVRNVEHVLNSCGHASLCAECSQRCDVCPICRTSIPSNGSRVQLRLYYKCIEAGLIPKRQDDRFQQKEENGGHLMADIQRLYALFDVALKNNLISLICHYVTDVCMDESAVSSDPVIAFLLDEVVVKDWCKQSFDKIICGLQEKYSLGAEEMQSELSSLQKSVVHLTGISSVLEVMVSSFKESFSGQLHDLHHLLESTLKAKQHLEVMIWCARHQFLEKIQPRFPNYTSWVFHVHEKKSAAVKRAWPDISSYSPDFAGSRSSMLFIEEALSNLCIEQGIGKEREEVDVTCLQGRNSPLLFQSMIHETNENEGPASYPFESVRVATDILFLHGTSDTVVAKRAIFLYYLFDRHWTRPDEEWRHVVDDFAASFGISRHSLLESLAFYLLDDHSDLAVQEASYLLTEIAGPETHPKIAQVLLEHQRPDVALTVLRCIGHDAFSVHPRSEHDGFQCIASSEVVAAVRVRIESGLLTEAFMYQRMYCSKVKAIASANASSTALSSNCKNGSWLNQVEILVSEICHLCIRRNLVDRMIELPWDSVEEKFLHKCLLGHACQNPSSIHGSLLVVFYLQRYRYIEAYQVDHKLRSLEQKETVSENTVYSMVQSLSHWRTGLVDKCVDLLPEVQRKQVIAGSMDGWDLSFSQNIQTSPKSGFTNAPPNSAIELTPSFTKPSVILQKSSKSFPSRKHLADSPTNFTSTVINAQLASGNKVPSVVQHRLLASFTSPSTRMNSVVDKIQSSNSHDDDSSPSNDIYSRDVRWPDARLGFQSLDPSLSSSFRPDLQITKGSAKKVAQNDHQFLAGNGMKSNDPISPEEHTARLITENDLDPMDTSHGNGQTPYRKISANLLDTPSRVFLEEANSKRWSFGKRDSSVEDSNVKVGSRWRSDEASEDEEEKGIDKHRVATPFPVRRPVRFSRR